MSCRCCDQPSCPAAYFRWDTDVASKTAPSCYFNGFIVDPDTKYRKREILTEVNNSRTATEVNHSPDRDDETAGYTDSRTETKTERVDYSGEDGCAAAGECEGEGSIPCDWTNSNGTDVGNTMRTIAPCTGVITCVSSTIPSCGCEQGFIPTGCTTVNTSLDEADTATTRVRGARAVTTCHLHEDSPFIDGAYYETNSTIITETKTTTTLSKPYEIEDLKSEVREELEDPDGEYGDTGGSYYDRTGWTVTMRKGKAQIVHGACCYLKVWMEKRFTPKGGGDPTYTALTPYEYSKTGNPCFNDPDQPADAEDNIIYGPTYDLDVPEEEGTEDFVITKYSCLAGYEPAEGEPNGFPAEEEA